MKIALILIVLLVIFLMYKFIKWLIKWFRKSNDNDFEHLARELRPDEVKAITKIEELGKIFEKETCFRGANLQAGKCGGTVERIRVWTKYPFSKEETIRGNEMGRCQNCGAIYVIHVVI